MVNLQQKKAMTIRVSCAIYEAFKKLAEAQKRSISNQGAIVIEQFVKEQKADADRR